MDSLATVTDADLADFASGQITISVANNGTANDQLFISHEGNGAGQVEISGTDILIDGVIVGNFTGGNGASDPLVVTFNANAFVTEVEAVARRISFANVSDNPSELQRTITMQLTDGDGGASALESRVENVVAHNDAPTATSPNSLVAVEQTNLHLPAAGFSVSDLDSTNSDITATIAVGDGNLFSTAGDSGVVISGSTTATVTLTVPSQRSTTCWRVLPLERSAITTHLIHRQQARR